MKTGCMIFFWLLWAMSPVSARSEDQGTGEPKVKRIIFETQRIEGKIRRPQLVLIRAEQRPHIEPMLMQKTGDYDAVVDFVSESVIDHSPYPGAFKFSERGIVNYKP